MRAQQRESERQAEHLFQMLLQRAFVGEICFILLLSWPAELLYYRQAVI